MAAGNKREIKLSDGSSRIGDPTNYMDRQNRGGAVKLDLSGNRLNKDITDMFQVALASAMTTAALKSARP